MKHIIEGIPDSVRQQVQTLEVEPDDAGQRLDNFLMRHLKGVPKTHVYRIIRSGEVRINKGRAGADTRVQAGDIIRVPPVRVSERAGEKVRVMEQLSAAHVPAKSFPVLFEDDSFLAVNKPAGVAVHGGSGVSFGVIEQLRMARPGAKFLELVHRLDRETSGVLLVAKKRSVLTSLQNQFRERETGKIYLACVAGQWPRSKKVLNKPLHKYLLDGTGVGAGERRVKVVAKDDPDGMPSLTLVNVLAATDSAGGADSGYSLLEVTLKTGRTHQIRVHLASEGLPIAGDDKYGDFEHNKLLAKGQSGVALKRMFLHAWKFQCTHPVTGKRVALCAPLPLELAGFAANVLPAFDVSPLRCA